MKTHKAATPPPQCRGGGFLGSPQVQGGSLNPGLCDPTVITAASGSGGWLYTRPELKLAPCRLCIGSRKMDTGNTNIAEELLPCALERILAAFPAGDKIRRNLLRLSRPLCATLLCATVCLQTVPHQSSHCLQANSGTPKASFNSNALGSVQLKCLRLRSTLIRAFLHHRFHDLRVAFHGKDNRPIFNAVNTSSHQGKNLSLVRHGQSNGK